MATYKQNCTENKSKMAEYFSWQVHLSHQNNNNNNKVIILNDAKENFSKWGWKGKNIPAFDKPLL